MESVTEFLDPHKCSLWSVAAVVGILVVARICLRFLSDMCSGFWAFFLSPLGIGGTNLLKYGKWAVVTGASEGIGYGYALELARRGFNVVLMSRSKDKLDKVAKEIEEKYHRECRVIAVDFSEGQDIYSNISEQLRDLDIGVLVNNVGLSYGDKLGNVPAKHLYKIVEINCQAAVQMTRMVLPKMLEHGGGYIINLSSVLSLFAAPYLSVYSATKTVQPHYVSTRMTYYIEPGFFIPNETSYARTAVATIGIQDDTFGCFPHALLGFRMSITPTSIMDARVSKAVAKVKARVLKEQKNLKSE